VRLESGVGKYEGAQGKSVMRLKCGREIRLMDGGCKVSNLLYDIESFTIQLTPGSMRGMGIAWGADSCVLGARGKGV
jgi:hypothetical protein